MRYTALKVNSLAKEMACFNYIHTIHVDGNALLNWSNVLRI